MKTDPSLPMLPLWTKLSYLYWGKPTTHHLSYHV
ncbi:hypothetical protein GBAR_LOCUS15245 [Geodia barretti]|uniref:Uncharacterized protein n=1 Tax=Geodia barretti TaxID=519541 RepID=A0AA35WN56_GEOBA|nr:hypothetical protein GBAR_LOCUS15245 [Geodia barretti]